MKVKVDQMALLWQNWADDHDVLPWNIVQEKMNLKKTK